MCFVMLNECIPQMSYAGQKAISRPQTFSE